MKIVYRYVGKAEAIWEGLTSGHRQFVPGRFISRNDFWQLPEDVTIKQEIGDGA